MGSAQAFLLRLRALIKKWLICSQLFVWLPPGKSGKSPQKKNYKMAAKKMQSKGLETCPWGKAER